MANDKVCDFRHDCLGGEDEDSCVKPFADFTNGDIGNWLIAAADRIISSRRLLAVAYSWRVLRTDDFTKPSTDHSANGSYLV